MVNAKTYADFNNEEIIDVIEDTEVEYLETEEQEAEEARKASKSFMENAIRYYYRGPEKGELLEILKIEPILAKIGSEIDACKIVKKFLFRLRNYPLDYPKNEKEYFERVCLFFQTLMKKGSDGNISFWKKMQKLSKETSHETILMALVKCQL